MEKTIKATDQILSTLIKKLEMLVNAHGMDAVDLGLNVIRLEGIAFILTGIIIPVIVSLVGFFGSRELNKWVNTFDTSQWLIDNWCKAFEFIKYVLFGFSVIFFSARILDFWYGWVKIYDPKLYLAKAILERALGQ